MTALTPVVRVEGETVYSLQPKQMEALRATPLAGGTATHIGYGGAAGAAKSHLARAVCALAAIKWPGSTAGIFRRTYPELRENHMVPFRQEIPGFDGRLYTFKASDKVAEWANGSRTVFGHLDRDEDVFGYQGWQFDVMVFEEATHYSWFQVSWLTGNRLRANVDEAVPFALYPTNPGNRGHAWFKRLFIDRNFRDDLNEDPADYTFVQAKLTDNAILMDRDPGYIKKLNNLPEPLRSQLRDGDWTAGAGLALPGLRRDTHIVPAFEPPETWFYWNAYDPGFNHPFSFGHFCADPDGNAYLIDTVTGRHLLDPQVIDRIKERPSVRLELARNTHAGHDAWADRKARGEVGPTTAERFSEEGFRMARANISRKSGLQNLRHYIDTTISGRSSFFIMDTPTNRQVFDQLEAMVTDPDDPEDALKIDADAFGDGGDDHYDMVRYGLMARPRLGKHNDPPAKADPNYKGDTLSKIMKRLNEQNKRGKKRPGFGY